MGLFGLLKKSAAKRKLTAPVLRFRPSLEGLESRLVPTASGNAWPNPGLITISFMPDGTNLGTTTSNLFATFNGRFGAAATWQNVILKAAQVWAQQTNLNFAVVSDDGSAAGSGSYQQGAPNFGDIRIGGYNFGSSTLAQAYMPPPVNNYSVAGDISFNTGQPFNINGQAYDLFTVAMHEFGHALGLAHSSTISAAMYGSYTGVKSGLVSDDISTIRSVYSNGSPRSADAFGSLNNSVAAAANINSYVNAQTGTALVPNMDITVAGEKDYYTVTAPSAVSSTVTFRVQSQGLSLLAPRVYVYAADGVTQIGYASGAGQYGATVTVNVANGVVTPNEVLYVKVVGADSTALGTGAYALTASFAGNPLPTVPLPNTQVLNGTPLSGGGGIAVAESNQYQVANSALFSAQLFAESRQAVALDPYGNYVAVWSSNGQDGDGWGVYAQRYDLNGNPYGPTTRVNSTTVGDQTEPAIAMSANGTFVVTWASYNQDGSGWGVYAQRYNSNWRRVGTEFQVNTTTAGDQLNPSVAMDTNGNFIVSWSSNPYDGTGWNIMAQRFDNTGAAVGGEFQVNANATGDHLYSQAAMDDAGDFVISWSSSNQDGSGWGVYARRWSYDTTGVLQDSGEFQVNTTTSGDQMYPSVAMTASGKFVISWSSYGQDGQGWGVYAQMYDATGAAVGTEFQVNTTTAGDQMYSSVAVDPDGDFIVSWQSNAGGQTGNKIPVSLNATNLSLNGSVSNLTQSSGTVVPGKDLPANAWNIYAQQFDASGARVGDEFRVNTTTAGANQFASVGWDRMGHIVTVWSTTGTALGLGDGIFAQRYAVGADNLDAPDAGTADAAPTAADPTGFRLQDLIGATAPDFTATVSVAGLADLGSLGNLLKLTDNTPARQSFDDFFAAAALDPVQEDILSPLLAGTGMGQSLDGDVAGATAADALAS